MKTSVSWAEPDRVLLRGYRLRDLIGRVEFGQAAYLLLVGELPDATVGKMVEAILVAVIDHGPTAPAAKAAITVAGSGASLSASVAAGVLAVTRPYGGAIEEAMMTLEASVGMGLDPYESATEMVGRYRSRGLRIQGIGTSTRQEDPRAVRLLAYAEELGISGPYVEELHALRRAVSQTLARELPINVIGAIAALLCEIKFPRQAANGLFLMSRAAGLVAHAVEAQARYTPGQSVETEGHAYDGPPERSFDPGM